MDVALFHVIFLVKEIFRDLTLHLLLEAEVGCQQCEFLVYENRKEYFGFFAIKLGA